MLSATPPVQFTNGVYIHDQLQIKLHPYAACFFREISSHVILSVGFIIHDLTTNSLPCKGVSETTVGTNTLDLLEDSSYDTCVSPLSHGSKMAKVTLEMFNHTNTILQVVIAVSKEASCNPPGVVVAAETVEKIL